MTEYGAHDVNGPIPIDRITESVRNLLVDNIAHFEGDESELGRRLHNGLRTLQDGLERMLTECEPVRKVCSNYDLSPEEPGNGIRSSVSMTHTSIRRIFELLKQLSKTRIFIFSKKQYAKELEAWGQVVSSMATLLDYLNTVLIPNGVDGDLLPLIDMTSYELFSLNNTVAQEAFSGRCHAFQCYESMQKFFKAMSISLCAFSEIYYSDGGFLKRTAQSLKSSKYALNPETRAKRLVDITQYCSIEFLKSWFSIFELEIFGKFNTLLGHVLIVEESIIVPCKDLEIESVDGQQLVIEAPNSCFEPKPIPCYLLSASIREGMKGTVSKGLNIGQLSDAIIFHCHGGGFISQSTKMQAAFLREWAIKTEVPIFSVDYSLSPNAKYPRALEEILLSYVWMLKNFRELGTTGKRIIVTGDSAGGNLIAALTVKCLEMGIRAADSVFLIYSPLLLRYNPCASRLIEVMDPLLPLGFAAKCLKAYAHLPPKLDYTSNNKYLEKDISLESKEEINLTKSELEVINYNVQNGGESLDEMDGNINKMAGGGVERSGSITSSATEPESSNDVSNSSRKYVNEFLEKYVTDTIVDKEGRSIPMLRSLSEEHAAEELESIPCKAGKSKNIIRNIKSSRKSFLNSNKVSEISTSNLPTGNVQKNKNHRSSIGNINLGTSLLKGEESNSLIEEFDGVNINFEHYVSPYLTPREILAKFPPTYFMTSEYDFALDDSVMMAKVLRSLGVKTKLKMLEKLPHGFLNLNLLSKEAHIGNKLTIDMLNELLHLSETN